MVPKRIVQKDYIIEMLKIIWGDYPVGWFERGLCRRITSLRLPALCETFILLVVPEVNYAEGLLR